MLFDYFKRNALDIYRAFYALLFFLCVKNCVLFTGVAPHAIHLMHGLETWDMKIAAALNGTQPINDNEWIGLLNLMEEWMSGIDEAVQYVGSTQKEEDRIESKPHIR